MAQWVKDSVLSLLWLGSLLCGLGSIPGQLMYATGMEKEKKRFQSGRGPGEARKSEFKSMSLHKQGWVLPEIREAMLSRYTPHKHPRLCLTQACTAFLLPAKICNTNVTFLCR